MVLRTGLESEVYKQVCEDYSTDHSTVLIDAHESVQEQIAKTIIILNGLLYCLLTYSVQ